MTHKICEIERKDSYLAHGFILKGGSIHCDGKGTYTTEECLFSEGRNAHMTKEAIEETLKGYLGVVKTIWLKRGIYNDETNGHVDLNDKAAEKTLKKALPDRKEDTARRRKHPLHNTAAAKISKLAEKPPESFSGGFSVMRSHGDRPNF